MKRGPISLLVATLLVSVLAGGVGAQSTRSGVEITAEFADAGAIIPGNDVFVDGVKAGAIERLNLVDGTARVTFTVDAAFTPLHEDATATIRSVSLLGERYLDLTRGTPSAPTLPDGGVIPLDRTERAVELQEILDVVDQPTGTALAALIVAFGEGMATRGEDAAAAIDAMEPALTETARLLEILGGQNQLLAALIDRSEPVAGAMAAERGARLDRLVAASDDLLGATAAHRPELEAALQRLPGALSTARAALVELSNLAGQTTPVLASLRPFTGDLRQMAIELGGFADAAGPALASADPVLERARELVAAAAPVTAELRAAAGDVETAARGTRTVVEALPEDASNLLDFIRNASLAIGGRDSLSHYLRIFVLATTGSVGAVPAAGLPLPVAGPPVAGTGGPAPAASAAGSPPKAGVPALPLPGLVGQVGKLLGGEDRGSATGLTFDQERSLLNYLLGAG